MHTNIYTHSRIYTCTYIDDTKKILKKENYNMNDNYI